MIKTLIVVPMKTLSVSKTRLAGTLSSSARTRLVRLLYQKTLNFLIPFAAKEQVDIAVVTKCKYAKDIAKKLDVRIIHEPNNLGLSGAILHSAIVAKAMGFERLCIIPADLAAPLKSDLTAMLNSDSAVTICPSSDLGTNALVVTPPDIIPFRYGSRSSLSHLQEAKEKGISARIMKLDSFTFDIDTNKCLARAIRVVPEIAGICA
jgi:2-phospho-L-lactate guanylyltransferase